MNSTRVISGANFPADSANRRIPIPEHKAIGELRIQLRHMRNAAKPFLTDETRKVCWAKACELSVLRAATRTESNRKQIYDLWLAGIISAITVPSLVGLNSSGAGGTAVRWLASALSLIATPSTAIIALFQSPTGGSCTAHSATA